MSDDRIRVERIRPEIFECSVLRCPEQATAFRTVDAMDPLSETFAVCPEHLAQLDRGEPFKYDINDRVVLMGADLDAADMRPVTALLGVSQDSGDPTMITVKFGYDEAGSNEPITLRITEDVARALTVLLPKFLTDMDGQPLG
ncbi:hypothetical protein [Puerhibacterium puerhi]|uniref:hypothetical protein n=1 Tax=Puerhibacterium puerhi TaxID=2692623 RepID=UPI001358B5B0|nr:hypothetical protein [Puerhibacterium puerhi]